jgi:hypothetical protein
VKSDVTGASPQEPGPTGVAAAGSETPRTEASARRPSDVTVPNG